MSVAAWIPFLVLFATERPGFESGARLLIVASAAVQLASLLSAVGIVVVMRRAPAGSQRRVVQGTAWVGVALAVLLASLIRGLTGPYWVYEASLRPTVIDAVLVDVIGRSILPLAFVSVALVLAVPSVRRSAPIKALAVGFAVGGFVVASGLPSQPALIGPATAFAAAVGVLIATDTFERLRREVG